MRRRGGSHRAGCLLQRQRRRRTRARAPTPVDHGHEQPSDTTCPQHGYNAAANNVVNPSTKTGGTLNLLAGSDCDSWDPANTYYGWCWNMQRLFTRTLVGYTGVNGTQVKLVPDLATALGEHNADFTQWTYTLKSGLKSRTARPITPTDIKYGIERHFATDVINGGPSSYFIELDRSTRPTTPVRTRTAT